MMMHMPWVLVAMMLLLLILLGGALLAVRLLAAHAAHPDEHKNEVG